MLTDTDRSYDENIRSNLRVHLLLFGSGESKVTRQFMW